MVDPCSEIENPDGIPKPTHNILKPTHTERGLIHPHLQGWHLQSTVIYSSLTVAKMDAIRLCTVQSAVLP